MRAGTSIFEIWSSLRHEEDRVPVSHVFKCVYYSDWRTNLHWQGGDIVLSFRPVLYIYLFSEHSISISLKFTL